jgi:pyruvate dehydrogenase E2 component (dihydrolipoamide acetyltransferase)
MTMETGTIMQWLVQEGDTVSQGDVLLEVMTDKINIEVEAYESGTLLKIYYQEGDVVPVNQVIAYIGEEGEQVPDQPPALEGEDSAKSQKEAPVAEERQTETATQPAAATKNEKPRATPAARKWAREHDLSLYEIQGSGPRGRIHVEDVRRHLEQQKSQPVAPAKPATQTQLAKRTALSGMRKTIAERMQQSWTQVPHVTLHVEADVHKLIAMRQELLPLVEKKTGLRLSYTEMILKATAIALCEHPGVNVTLEGNEVVAGNEVNIGLAVSHEQGLLVPVIRNVDRLGLAELTEKSKQVAKEARQGRLSPDSLTGGTFTVSNLGMYAVDQFTPIINQPQTAILGVGRIRERAIGVDGELCLRPLMSLSLSFDHRVIDGAPAAEFLTTLVTLLENPYQLFV